LYKEKDPEERLQSDAKLSMTTTTEVDLLFENMQASLSPQKNELTRYLESRTSSLHFLLNNTNFF
jgi:hypothetical protein